MMQSEEPKLKIVVNDGVIDLRNQVFDQDDLVHPSITFPAQFRSTFDGPPFSKKLSGSEPTLQKKTKRRIPVAKDMQRVKQKDFMKFRDNDMSDMSTKKETLIPTSPHNNLRKLAENLYNGPSSFSSGSSNIATAMKPTVIRNKPILRSKLPRTRATSADPRFRRTRSPSSRNHTLVTQSESRVSPGNSEQRQTSQSDSKFIVDHQPLNTDQRSSSPLGRIGEHQGDSLHSSTRQPQYNININTKRPEAEETMDDITEKTSEKISDKSSDGTIIEKDETPLPSMCEEPNSVITEPATIIDPAVLNVSLCAEDPPPINVDVYNASLSKTVKLFDHIDQCPEQLKPFWDDPRLLDKYGKLLKPVSIAPTKSISSWTLPVETQPSHVDLGDTGDFEHCEECLVSMESSDRRLLRRTCSKCTCTFERDSFVTDYSLNTMHYERTKERIFGLSLFFLVGSACGLLLVALVIWVLANDLVWLYLQKTAVPKFTGFTSWVAYYCGGIIYSITYVVKTVGYLFVLPRNEVYDTGTKTVVQNEPWYAWLWPWT